LIKIHPKYITEFADICGIVALSGVKSLSPAIVQLTEGLVAALTEGVRRAKKTLDTNSVTRNIAPMI